MGAVMFLRMMQRKSPFYADRQHLHYRLLDAGMSSRKVVCILAAVSVTFSLLALTAEAHGVPEAAMFCAFLVLLFGYVALLARPGSVTKALVFNCNIQR
jgi:UDP-GlcNAc:undecaprenyl-phosphate GlcNAc-1-phosphate transferase